LLLTITTTHRPATDLGYLLHKNPAKAQAFDLPVGKAHVFYPEATEERCTVALIVDINPVTLARTSRRASLRQYVNDRPYVASSFMSSALLKVFGSAMSGSSKDRPELATTPIPLTARLAMLPSRGGEPVLRRLFEPLGYKVLATPHQLDERFPAWGPSEYLTVELTGRQTVASLLQHLYVLIPTLDDDKHYWVDRAEVDKLMLRGGDWLAGHPDRDLIVRRYLKGLRSFTTEAFERLFQEEPQTVVSRASEPAADSEQEAEQEVEEEAIERPLGLADQRMETVARVLKAAGARRILDLGCGEGRLLRRLLSDPLFEEVVGVDASMSALTRAKERLGLDRLPETQRSRVKLLHSSLTYRDNRLAGFDGAAVIEVVEHIDPARLLAFERSVFEFAAPGVVALTTPNADYNVRFRGLGAGRLRHPDHRFEWSHHAFRAWSEAVATRFGYRVTFEGIGAEDPEVGAPTQMAVFSR
jgi:3' terminal RNA ribose 2'-O-methyltransferase Hen1